MRGESVFYMILHHKCLITLNQDIKIVFHWFAKKLDLTMIKEYKDSPCNRFGLISFAPVIGINYIDSPGELGIND